MVKKIKSQAELKKMGVLASVKEYSRQRRVWSAILSLVAVVGTLLGLGAVVAVVCSALAGALGLDSYVRPSEVVGPVQKKKRGRPKKK